jgi:hypothetical protein
MSTTLKGAPIIGLPSGTLPKITATLRYTRDYAGGVLGGLGAGSHEIEYVWPAPGSADMFAGDWRHVVSLAPVLVAAAPFAGGGVQPEGVIFIGGSIKYATGNAQPFELRRLPVETSAGVMDLRIQIDPPAYTTPQSLADLIDSLEGLDTSVAAGLVQLDAGLADIAQTQATLEAATATALGTVGTSPNQIYDEGAALGAAPDGTYAAQFQPSGLFQRLKRVAGAWVNSGSALMTLLGLQLRLGGVNVRDYGAKGDGVTNDSAAFAAAEAAAFAAGKWVRIPDGNFLLNSEFTTRVSVRMEDGTTLTAGAVMPAVIGTDGAVLYKNKRIIGGRVDGRNLAVRGMWMRWLEYSSINGTDVESPNLIHYQIGMVGSPTQSYEGGVNGVRGDRSRGTAYEKQNAGSIVLLVENCTDSHFNNNILIGADDGIVDRNGGNNHYHQQHAWSRLNENVMLRCFVVESAKTRWTQCTADTPMTYGWHIKNWHTTIGNSFIFNNGLGAPTTLFGTAYPGMTGIKIDSGVQYVSIPHLNLQGQSSKPIAKDIDAPANLYNLSTPGKQAQYVTEIYSTDYVQSSLSLGYVKRWLLNNLSAWWLNIKPVSGDLELQARKSADGLYGRSAVVVSRDTSEIRLNNQSVRQGSTDPLLNLSYFFDRVDDHRWGVNITPDTGVGNGGGEYRLGRYDNNGNYLNDALRIYRDSDAQEVRGIATYFGVYTDASDLNLFLTRNGSRRFAVTLSTESGGVGGNLNINRYNTAGVFVASSFKIDRATGAITATDNLFELAGTFDKPLILAGSYSLYINPGTGKLQLKSSRTPASASDGASLIRGNDLATTGTAGVVKMAAAMPNLAAAPTQADFNSLLQKLRDAGLLAP